MYPSDEGPLASARRSWMQNQYMASASVPAASTPAKDAARRRQGARSPRACALVGRGGITPRTVVLHPATPLATECTDSPLKAPIAAHACPAQAGPANARWPPAESAVAIAPALPAHQLTNDVRGVGAAARLSAALEVRQASAGEHHVTAAYAGRRQTLRGPVRAAASGAVGRAAGDARYAVSAGIEPGVGSDVIGVGDRRAHAHCRWWASGSGGAACKMEERAMQPRRGVCAGGTAQQLRLVPR
jgi:hypothetical protein